MKKATHYFTLLLLIVLNTISAAHAQKDSLLLLPIDEFIAKVKANHPVAKQANLRIEAGESTERMAKGGFDPKIEAGTDQKFYKETNYYSYTGGSLKIPTRSPFMLKGGYDLNNGTYLNPSATVPQDGLYNAGLSVSLLQGLITDERRTALAMARAYMDYTVAERNMMVNQLLYEAFGAYWNWWNAFEKTRVADEMTTLAETRFAAIRERALAGDRPFIDTVEAYLQVQFREQQFIENKIAEIKSRFYLSSFLWSEESENTAYEGLIIGENTRPSFPEGNWSTLWPTDYTKNIVSFVEESHPIVQGYDAKIDQLEAEQRWKREKLKPKLDIDYNLLSEAITTSGDNTFSTNNYKWGLQFSFPIFLREARGDLQLNKIKVAESQYDRSLKTVELANKASTSVANFLNLTNQLNIAEQNVANYQLLLEAERTKFFNGESSVFIINQREMALADAQLKVVDIRSKLEMSVIEAEYHIGQLYKK